MKHHRKMQFKAIMVVWTMVFLGFFVVIPSKSMAQKPEYLSLGLIGDMTGPYAPVAGPAGPGAEDGVKYVNEELGGIDGVKIKLESRDMQGKAALALQQYAELIASKPKPLFIGTVISALSEAIREKLVADGAIGLSVSCSVPTIYPRGNQYGFGALYPEMCALSVKYVRDNWREDRKLRLAILTWDSPYGRSIVTDEFFDYCKKIGVEIVGTEFFNVGEIDVTTHMTRLRAKKPDWLATSSLGGGPLSILKVAKEMGWNIKCLSGMAIDAGGIRLDPELHEGCVATHPYVFFDNPDHPGIKIMQKYMEKQRRTINEKTGPYIHGWTMALVMHKVIKDAVAKVGWNKLNLDAIKYQMDHLDFEPLYGIMKLVYSEKIGTTPWCITYKVQGGRMIFATPGSGYSRAPDLRPARFR